MMSPKQPSRNLKKKSIKQLLLFALLVVVTAAGYSFRMTISHVDGYLLLAEFSVVRDKQNGSSPNTTTTTAADPTKRLPNKSIVDAADKDDNKFASPFYRPSSTERYILENAVNLGYDTVGNAQTCTVWRNENETTAAVFRDLHAFRNELKDYNRRVQSFQPVQDIRLRMDEEDQEAVCQSLELHQDGLLRIFPSGQLSFSKSGYIEPLLPPLRHPDSCLLQQKKRGDGTRRRALMDLGYLVHDFSAMCRKLKRHSRIVLVDMGASLDFHKRDATMPAVYLTELFRKFGFPFDHVYAFEVTPTPADKVYKKVPAHLRAAYHWINVGVSADPESHLNPLKLILENFNEDDLIVIKLDIDTSSIEVPLATQLLQDDRYSNLVDQFYFEHHVRNAELAGNWRKSMKGSVKESLDLFAGLRKKGIPAHSWV